MPSKKERIVRLPSEQADYIDTLVAQGRYATGSEVVRAGLSALQDRDAAVERWLREDVVPAALAMQTDPDRGVSVDQVFDDIRTLHAGRAKIVGDDL